jgi:hypothetical protein
MKIMGNVTAPLAFEGNTGIKAPMTRRHIRQLLGRVFLPVERRKGHGDDIS